MRVNAFALLLASGAALAQSSEIFLCVDEQGNKRFETVGSGKDCKRIDVGPVPVPEPRPATPSAAPAPKPKPARVAPPSTLPAVSEPSRPRRSTGTAFVVSAQGHAVTALHVVDGCTTVRSAAGDVAAIVATDRANDLAVVQLPGRGIRPAAKLLADVSRLRQGEEIVVYGFPLAQVLSDSGNVTPGIVSALSGLNGDRNRIQITAPIQPGSSGSPVLTRYGDVVGVASSSLSDEKLFRATGAIPQAVNFATSSAPLRALLDANKVAYVTGRAQTPRDVADLADDARKWTTRIECERN
jgi:S1-C subfamily serine protease